jgi:hypothetical protein
MIWMADILALFTLAGPSWMTIWPLEGWILLNTLSSATFSPPASVKMSKLVKTWFTLMEKLNTLSPAALK